ncbi:uncharacterized protein LOC123315814 [Coccinella septempunctata]|uniref:uncharacterized protein LOC123306721 n=1 Tax=Coccinella septempunctata TaxID=41139 RepID=UPI001D06F4DF|nr:uncharacterized protein LOC123306721 [Coccinella septempunctata]XP_044755618.1 uncharacterized protein LOC123314400 [Coccinella septempunctata]XP_044755672.1 uncharacterized protein LOC123314444 [Coccinella septempunctata]XP_044755673.1 uncharacterized protein LOC123314444 [Coccinella septempunctata]XP_044757610.1 uncharacterized protein LOC123315814 [Coccinella septempunctata]XP_044757611.1 uncharacterized protein LOC123315814 [Coccinella septempunctata]
MTSFCASPISFSSSSSLMVFSKRCASTNPFVVMTRGRIDVEYHNIRPVVRNGSVSDEWMVPIQFHLLIFQYFFRAMAWWYAFAMALWRSVYSLGARMGQDDVTCWIVSVAWEHLRHLSLGRWGIFHGELCRAIFRIVLRCF